MTSNMFKNATTGTDLTRRNIKDLSLTREPAVLGYQSRELAVILLFHTNVGQH
jgi:hypothetical protein